MTRLFQIVLGLVVGAALAEGLFWLRDDGAFPHLNLYVADHELGARLMPNAEERVSFGGNPRTKVRTNAQGYRGVRDWPEVVDNAIAVVGGSQVFGLGVNDGETFSARLAVMSARPVLNAGVPTHGPPELVQTVRHVLATYHPKIIVLAINAASDLFEPQRPNRDRLRVVDGWAVTTETAPGGVTLFPGRDWLMRRSHLVYAARRLVHAPSLIAMSPLPSEAAWKELGALATAQVDDDGVEQRNALADNYQKALASDDSSAMLAELRRKPLPMARVASPLNAMLGEFASICHVPECDPVLLVLPADVQVAASELAKYGLDARDMTFVSSLTDRVVRSAATFGIRAVDALPALTSAEPGAFLDADIHLTPKGHSAVARALATELIRPSVPAPASGALAPGRTRVPAAEEFRRAPPTSLKGARPEGCEAAAIDEWLRVQCRSNGNYRPVRVTLLHGSRDSFVTWTPDALTVVVPLLAAAKIEAEFVWHDRAQHFTAERDDEGAIVATFAAPWLGKFDAEDMSAQAERMCSCAKVVSGSAHCDDVYGSAGPECAATYLKDTHDAAQCAAFLACAQGFIAHLPTCPPGTTLAGGTMQCVQQCSADVACKEGQCVSWPDTAVCLGEL